MVINEKVKEASSFVENLVREIEKVIAREVVYLGGLPRANGLPLADYLRRAARLCDGRRGMVFHAEVHAHEAPRALETWQRVQDELWP